MLDFLKYIYLYFYKKILKYLYIKYMCKFYRFRISQPKYFIGSVTPYHSNLNNFFFVTQRLLFFMQVNFTNITKKKIFILGY